MPHYRYRLYWADGSDAGEAHYAVRIRVGETILTGDGRRLVVNDVVDTPEPESKYAALLMVAPES